MKIELVLATSREGLIGSQGRLPWELPGDLKRFRKLTLGSPIIMGRRTHESIGRTLPGRLNILITRNRDYEPATGTVCATSVEESLQIARDSGAVRAFVIGGSMIYDLFLDQADVIHWTVVSGSFQGDTFFEIDRFRTPDWELVEELMFPADAANRFDCTVSRLIRTSETRAQSATI